MDKANPTDASTQWTDTRPTTCRHRLMDEGKPYPRSSCQACARTIRSGLGNACSLGALTGPASPNDRALLEMAVEALMDATAHLAGASSAYAKHAGRSKAIRPRAIADPFYMTRVQDFDAATLRARSTLTTIKTALETK